jgi:hypothetical protein
MVPSLQVERGVLQSFPFFLAGGLAIKLDRSSKKAIVLGRTTLTRPEFWYTYHRRLKDWIPISIHSENLDNR